VFPVTKRLIGMRDKIEEARKSLERQGFVRKPKRVDVNYLDYSLVERADVLLPGGAREVWLKPKIDAKEALALVVEAFDAPHYGDMDNQLDNVFLAVEKVRFLV
jgi:hypothetical protein